MINIWCRSYLRQLTFNHFTARCSYASAVLGVVILSVCLSVRLSVICVLCDETETMYTADILLPYERAITLVFWQRQWLVGDAPFRLKFAQGNPNQFQQGHHNIVPHLQSCDYCTGACVARSLCHSWATCSFNTASVLPRTVYRPYI